MNWNDVKVGDVFFTGSFTHDGKPNYAACTGRHGTCTPGFYAHFVNPDNFREKRLADDRDFFVWQSELDTWTPAGTFYAPNDPLELRHR